MDAEPDIGTAVADCLALGLVFGWHPGFQHAEGDPRRDFWVPQETGWWCRTPGDDGMDTRIFPTLREALDDCLHRT